MKYFSILAPVLMITLILSACGAKATPTTSTVDIQTVAAVAFTMVAETQAAIPTATPPPPTASPNELPADTPVPIDTFLPLPTSIASEIPVTPVPNSNSGGGDPCINKALPASLQGKAVKMRINNSTKATLSISVYLLQTTSQSQCGYRSYTLAPGQSIVISDLVEGCYTLWAWNPDPKDYFIVTNGASCVDSSDSWVFDITTRDINFRT
jgi:hypothetical protein